MNIPTFFALFLIFVNLISGCHAEADSHLHSSDQLRFVHGNQSMDLGDGFDSISDQVRDNPCITHEGVTLQVSDEEADEIVSEPLATGGLETNRSLAILTDPTELANLILNLTPADLLKASLRSGPSAAAEFYHSFKFNRYSVYLVTQTRVITGSQRMRDVALSPNKVNLLKRNPEIFFRLCGDRYISRINYGGEYVGVIEIATTSKSDHQILVNQLREHLGDQSSNLDEALVGREVHVKPFFRGLRLQPQDRPRTVNEIRNTTATYANQVHRSFESPISAVLKDYEVLAMASMISELSEHSQPEDFSLFDVRPAQSHLIEIASRIEILTRMFQDIDYIRSNPSQFERLTVLKNGTVRETEEYLIEMKADVFARRTRLLALAEACLDRGFTCRIVEIPSAELNLILPDRKN